MRGSGLAPTKAEEFGARPPFPDGNGRTGRLLLNLVLVRIGYAPTIVYERDRAEYLKALLPGSWRFLARGGFQLTVCENFEVCSAQRVWGPLERHPR